MKRDLSYERAIRLFLGQVYQKPWVKFLNVEIKNFEHASTFLVFVGSITKKGGLYGIHYILNQDKYYFGTLTYCISQLHRLTEHELKVVPKGIRAGCIEVSKTRQDRIIQKSEWR